MNDLFFLMTKAMQALSFIPVLILGHHVEIYACHIVSDGQASVCAIVHVHPFIGGLKCMPR